MSINWIIFRAILLTPWLIWLCRCDVKSRRLPNAGTLGGLAVGLLVQSGWWGLGGLQDGLLAACVALVFLLVPFLIRAAGAGDVKMLAACSSFIGLRLMPLFLMLVSFAGLFVAVWMLYSRQASGARLKHYFRCAFDWRYDRAAGRAALPAKDDERFRIPFGVAIAIGAVATVGLELAMAVRM